MRIPASSISDAHGLNRLRRGRRYSAVGWATAFGSLAVLVSPALSILSTPTAGRLAALGVAASLTLINSTRLWVKESREPFRFTYSVGEFEAEEGGATATGGPGQERMAWLSRDLAEKLGERVQRLSLRPESAISQDESGEVASHVHVSGWYGMRFDDSDEGGQRNGRWLLEVVPQVRLGDSGSPARLGQAVRVRLVGSRSTPPRIDHDTYRGVFERVYWSVASEIYSQIGRGVTERIGLLPPGRLRAAARLYEANDYAMSNTLDAYGAARTLFQQAREWYDPRYRPRPATPWRKWLRRQRLRLSDVEQAVRGGIAEYVRRAGRREVLTARAEMGYARMLVTEWYLRQLSGTLPENIFEAKPAADRAVERLEKLPADTEGLDETLFRARLTLALTRRFLQDRSGAVDALCTAERSRPVEARRDAEFLYVSGLVEPGRLSAIRLFRQAAERNPGLEGAHFSGAVLCEELWRRRPRFEPEIARLVDAEYRAVVEINPGNIAAWANRGYVSWLLAGASSNGSSASATTSADDEWDWRAHARFALETGRQYKEVRREALVAELDWNLARLAAEDGDFRKAYAHYIDTVSAQIGEPRLEFEDYFYGNAGPALLERFEDYRDTVATHKREAARLTKESGGPPDHNRLARSVMAFVHNDCGLAYKYHHERSGEAKSLRLARQEFKRAREANPSFVLSTFNLAQLHYQLWQQGALAGEEEDREAHLRKAAKHLEEVQRREPSWIRARLLMVEVRAELAASMTERREEMQLDDETPPASNRQSTPVPDNELYKRRAEAADLDRERFACREKVEGELGRLLPHARFHPQAGECILDTDGGHVESLVDDREISWERDFGEIHVGALIQWCKVLAADSGSAGAAFALCDKLRDSFYHGAPDLLVAQRGAAESLLGGLVEEGESQSKADLKGRIDECNALLEAQYRMNLVDDPTDYRLMSPTALAWFDVDDQREALMKARDELERWPSSATLLAVGDGFVGIGTYDKAADVYAKVAQGQRSPKVKAVANLRRGEALVAIERTDEALEALEAASLSGDPQVAPVAAMAAGRLVEEGGAGPRAMAIYSSAATSSADVAMALGQELEGNPELRAAAIDVYNTALDLSEQDTLTADAAFHLGLVLDSNSDAARTAWETVLDAEAGTEREAFARIQLARNLRAQESPDQPQIEQLLQGAIESGHDRQSALASLALAEILIEDDDTEKEDQIDGLLRRALGYGDPAVTGDAAVVLGRRLEGQGRGEDARQLYLDAAGSSSQVALRLASALREAGQPELALAVCETGATLEDHQGLFAPDVRLLQAGLLAEQMRDSEAEAACREAIAMSNPLIGPRAAILLADIRRRTSPGSPVTEPYADVLKGFDLLEAAFFVFRVGFELVGEGKTEEAEAVYRMAAKRDSLAALRLGDLLRDEGDLQRAEGIYRIGLNAGGLYVPDLQLRLGELVSGDNPDEARKLYEAVVASGDITVAPDANERLAQLADGASRPAGR